MARLRICLLGGFQPCLDGAPLPLRLPRKATGLLACLAAAGTSGSSRGALASRLWARSRPEEGRHSVRQALLSIRQALAGAGGSAALSVADDALALDRGFVDVDVWEFEASLDNGSVSALEEAAALYRGDFLDGFLVGEPAFDEWARGERDRLRERARRGLSGLLAQQSEAGAVEPAIETALQLLRLDHTEEHVHRTLIQLYNRQGRRADALRQYRTCAGMLRSELGAEPAPETVRLYREIVAPRATPRSPVPEP